MNEKIKTNLNSRSEIYKIFKKSKKSSVKWTSYFQVYDQIFKKYKNKKITFVEVGVANGGSLFVWKKYLIEINILCKNFHLCIINLKKS